MNAEGTGASIVGGAMGGHAFDEMAELAEGAESCVHVGSDSGGAIAGDTVFGDEGFDGFERGIVAFHNIVSCAAVDVKIDEARGEDGVSEIGVAAGSGNFQAISAGDLGDHAVLKNDDAVVNAIQRRKDFTSGEDGLHGENFNRRKSFITKGTKKTKVS